MDQSHQGRHTAEPFLGLDFLRSFGPRPWRWSASEWNVAWAGLFAFLAPFVGSASTVLMIGAFFWAGYSLATRRTAFLPTLTAIVGAAAFASFFFAEGLAAILPGLSWPRLEEMSEDLIFLAFLPLALQYRRSPRFAVAGALCLGAALGCLVALPIALVQSWFLQTRALGFSGNPGPFGLMTLIFSSICLTAMLQSTRRWRLFYLLAWLAGTTAVLLSGMRTFWPMLIFNPLLVVAIMRFRSGVSLKFNSRRALAVLATLMVVGAMTYPSLLERVRVLESDYRLTFEEGNYHNSLGERLLIWSVGAEMIREKPILGHGLVAAREGLTERSTARRGYKIGYSHFHNGFMNAWVRAGLPGLFSVIWILGFLFWAGLRAGRDRQAVLGTAILAVTLSSYLASGMVGLMLGHDIIDSVLIFLAVTGAFLSRPEESSVDSLPHDRPMNEPIT